MITTNPSFSMKTNTLATPTAAPSKMPDIFRLGTALLFLMILLWVSDIWFSTLQGSYLLIAATVIGGYMAMNIGANDVANNVGPAVGSKALTLVGAIVLAAIFEASGALIAGGDVVSTIKKGIINPNLIEDANTFIWLMMAALLAAAIWLNLATAFGAPVSTTHSIVGGVLGAGIAAGGFGIAAWGKMGAIVASWVISPVMGGIIAAIFLYLIKRTITYRSDKIAAAKRMVPLLITLMTWSFSTYLILKGLKKIWKTDFPTALAVGLALAILAYFIVRPLIVRAANKLPNHKDSINQLFTIPLIFSAALLSFAHGANDVANAVGPLAAINDSVIHGGIAQKAAIPLWIMAVGAIGIALGLALYGPKLIRTVGSEITHLDPMRAFSVAMAASITVIIASQLGLPVSSTHIAVGAVFGVGFLREYLKASYECILIDIKEHHADKDASVVDKFLGEFETASAREKCNMLLRLKHQSKNKGITKKERKVLKKLNRKELVKRSAFSRIIAAWLITVPVSAVMAAMFYFMIRGILV